MKLNLREKFLIVLSSVLLVLFCFGNWSLPISNAGESINSEIISELKTFTDVLALVKSDYVGDVFSKDLVQGAIRGMLTTLDPHSSYLDPDFYKDLELETEGEFGGLGIEVSVKDGLLVVVSPMEGSPAEIAGVKAGDKIIKIDGKFTKQFSLIDAVKKLRGAKGSAVIISVQRANINNLIDIRIVRDNIQLDSVRSRYLGDGYGIIRISQFVKKTTYDIEQALKSFRDQSPENKIQGLIIDLRNNPGGLLNQAVRISDLFIEEGLVVYTEGRIDGQDQKYYAHAKGTEPNYPIVALVNGGSASASEIVSGALQADGRAIIVGTQTFGKGSVQTITPLSNGGAVTLTTALYYLKNGNSIQATGVKPDIEVADYEEAPTAVVEQAKPYLRESDLPGSINNPAGVGDPMRKMNQVPEVSKNLERIDLQKSPLEKILEKDPQLQKALEIVKNFSAFKK